MQIKPDLNAKWVDIESLEEYSKNAKKHDAIQISKIAQQIKNAGFRVPITVRSKDDLTVVTGHGRLRAAKGLGMKEVPVLFLDDLDDNTVKSWRIGDNKVGESEWDDAFLIEEFSDLQETGFDLELTGFENDEIQSLLDIPEDKEDDAELEHKLERKTTCPECGFEFVIKKKKVPEGRKAEPKAESAPQDGGF